MIASRYEPGDEPDETFCDEHDRVRPCRVCLLQAAIDRAESREEEKDQ